MTPTTASMTDSVFICPLSSTDCFEHLTRLLHRAYRPLADAGMQFMASHQPSSTTRSRCMGLGKDCFIADLDGVVVGTVTLRQAEAEPECAHYDDSHGGIVGQLAVEPSLQGCGIARKLMTAAEHRARDRGMLRLYLDASEHAHRLLATYQRWNFRIIGRIHWPEVNYHSLVHVKDLRGASLSSPTSAP